MKIKTNFTPGPWKTEKQRMGFSTADFIRAPCKYPDGELMHVRLGEKEYGWSSRESEANARLIASSPETFNTFVKLFIHSYVIGEVPGELQKECINLIEKVTGKKFFDILKEYGEEND